MCGIVFGLTMRQSCKQRGRQPHLGPEQREGREDLTFRTLRCSHHATGKSSTKSVRFFEGKPGECLSKQKLMGELVSSSTEQLPIVWLPAMFTVPSQQCSGPASLLMHSYGHSCPPFLSWHLPLGHLRAPFSPRCQILCSINVITSYSSLTLEHKRPHNH